MLATVKDSHEQGNLRAIKLLTDRKKLAFCRDSKGLAPLNKAVFWTNRKNLIRNYSESVNSMDQSRRTPLDYSAALRDGGLNCNEKQY
uniref:Uncharacterized protein n=1 Tax=Meloidogyne floridensis TaxID=298350 RepID=A0A915P4R8_9BILA